MLPPFQLEQTITTLVREEWGRILASLVASFNDWQLAEDVLQDAIEKALVQWSKDGLPDAPAAWLITTARRKAIDHCRRHSRFSSLAPEIAYLTQLNQGTESIDIDYVIPDKRLELIFTCCHELKPKLAPPVYHLRYQRTRILMKDLRRYCRSSTLFSTKVIPPHPGKPLRVATWPKKPFDWLASFCNYYLRKLKWQACSVLCCYMTPVDLLDKIETTILCYSKIRIAPRGTKPRSAKVLRC